MKKETLKRIKIQLVDTTTGEILKYGCRDFDFRFKSERDIAHTFLDDFITRCREYESPCKVEYSADDKLWLIFELCKHQVKQSLF